MDRAKFLKHCLVHAKITKSQFAQKYCDVSVTALNDALANPGQYAELNAKINNFMKQYGPKVLKSLKKQIMR